MRTLLALTYIIVLASCTSISEDQYIEDDQYDLCIEQMMDYHKAYPTFWTGKEMITIDPEEESIRFCDWYYSS